MSRGATLAGLGRINDAMASYRRALEIAPDYPEAHFAMGNLLHALGRGGDALASLDRALALRPDYAQAHSNRGIVLAVLDRQGRGARELRSCARAQPPLCRSVQQPQWRAALLIAMKRRWRTSNAVAVNQPFNLAYQGHDGRDLRSVYGALGSRIAACAFPAALPPPPAPHEPVRVGIVSGFFYLHSHWKSRSRAGSASSIAGDFKSSATTPAASTTLRLRWRPACATSSCIGLCQQRAGVTRSWPMRRMC